jgi:tetratricopeptide (TPR) repeat protein
MNKSELIGAAIALNQAGQLKEAIVCFEKLMRLSPGDYKLLIHLGSLALQCNEVTKSIKYNKKAIEINSNLFIAYGGLGLALARSGLFEEAIESYNKAIAINPDYIDAYFNRGLAYQALEQYGNAIFNYSQVINKNKKYWPAYLNRGLIFLRIGRNHQAIFDFDNVLSINPDNVDAYYNKGNALTELKLYQEALYTYSLGININQSFCDLFNNRGNAFFVLNRIEDALSDYEMALVINPGFYDAYINKANALRSLKQFDQACDCYNIAIAIKPDIADAYWNKSLLKLHLGDFDSGWGLYEWRWKIKPNQSKVRSYKQPLWLGIESIKNKTVLVYPEQGYGDFIQFCRFIDLLENMGAKVVLETPKTLLSLMRSMKGNFTIIEQDASYPDFDFHCPIMSLPLALKINVSTIPASIPYLYADHNKVNDWSNFLGHKVKPRIGLVWSGSALQKDDINRSIPLEKFESLLALSYDFHALQLEIKDADKLFLGNSSLKIHSEKLLDFSDTAALIKQMDLVITVCTSVAHLAGALGKPVWILLSRSACYRWMENTHDTPWYPTARLFRQTNHGDWENVINDISSQLVLEKL